MFQVYRIKNKKTNQVYIGSSVDVARRWRQHKEASQNQNDHHYNYPLMKAFREYGFDNFSFEIIEELLPDYKTMIQVEHNWIEKENCLYPLGYNQTSSTDSPMFDPVVAKRMSDTKRKKYGKRVCEIDSNRNIVRIWDSIVEASEHTKLNRFKISNVCNGTRLTTGNKIFRFLNENNEIIEPEKRVNQTQQNRIIKTSRQVEKIDLETGEIIQIYNSIALAGKDSNCDPSGISAVCRGTRNKCGGYKWKYHN